MSPFKCILLVDDDEVSNFLNDIVIKKSGIAETTHMSNNGKEALEFVLNNCEKPNEVCCPDLILLDINMPVMDGFEFLHAIEASNIKNQRQFKIVMLTSSDDKSDIELSQKFSVDGYILKPLSVKKLMKLVG